jgi:hypothetical protein
MNHQADFLLPLLLFYRNISDTAGDHDFHIDFRLLVRKRRDNLLRIDDFESGRRLEESGSRLPLSLPFEGNLHRFITRHTETNLLQIQDDLYHIFHDTGHGSKFMRHAPYLH